MSFRENEPKNQPDSGPQGEPKGEPRPYIQAARYPTAPRAGVAYSRLETLIAGEEVNLSAYRFQWQDRWHVAAVAEVAPAISVHQGIAAALKDGAPVSLPDGIVRPLLARHRQAMSLGLGWIAGHYGPGDQPA